MKFITALFFFALSLNVFASENLGYICLPADELAAKKLEKLAPKLGDNYLKYVKALIIEGESCAEVHAMIYKDICLAGPYTVQIGLESDSQLIIRGNNKIDLICNENDVVYPFPVLGGSN
jgi:hypothetical protein